MGYNRQIKLNSQQKMVMKYEADQWYRFDFILDWESQEVAFFIDGIYKTKLFFYTKERDAQKACEETFVNMLMLYTLTPGSTAAFRDVRLCEDLCPGTQDMEVPLSYVVMSTDENSATIEEIVPLDNPLLVFEVARSTMMFNLYMAAIVLAAASLLL